MKKIIGLCCAAAVVLIFCSCSPTFRSVKEADDYVAKERKSASDKATYFVDVPNLLGLASFVITPGTSIAKGIQDEFAPPDEYIIPWRYKYKQITQPYASAKGSVSFNRRDFVYRKETGQPAMSLFMEAFQETGEMPECVITKVLTKKLWHPSSYQGEDGQIITAEGFFIKVDGASRKGSEATCTPHNLRAYLDKVLNRATIKLNQQIHESNATK